MMNQRTRQVMAVMIVSAALCADRAIAAAPALRPAVGDIATRFVDRLARNLGRTVTGVKLRQTRSITDRPAVFVSVPPIKPTGLHAVASPFQFRLPPPLV
jgi:hypothetical protein